MEASVEEEVADEVVDGRGVAGGLPRHCRATFLTRHCQTWRVHGRIGYKERAQGTTSLILSKFASKGVKPG